ncbi:MAG: TIGR00303 family protein [Limnothrix sp. RL_2_0]|nr:TIGR00303 family protein [Limnothrix sp. RL_2_0]
MIRIYTQQKKGQAWLDRFQGQSVLFAGGLGFTETALIPNISAAGATPESRQYTAIADAECLCHGWRENALYPLPPLTVGASPAILSRAMLQAYDIPFYLFNTGLAIAPATEAVRAIDIGGMPAKCVSTGQALNLATVKTIFEQGLHWGKTLAKQEPERLFVLGECVVAGTTTALAVLTGLGYNARGKVNSSYVQCNHDLKWQIVQQGLSQAQLLPGADPFAVVAAVGDPMQIFVAGMAIAASQTNGILLAGGTQMLAVYALIKAITAIHNRDYDPENIVVGTTRWVAEDETGDTVGLAKMIGDVPLLATQLSFADSKYPPLQSYEQGYVKEGVGAGGLAIAAHLAYGATQTDLLHVIESTCASFLQP